ncbi:MAG: glutamine amidotransferase [Ruminococcaceae bacterium]|nr:glutamine amidotransferase [Oscillospiraceae bacterium]
MSDFKLNIVHLYPDILNLYGDKGNIETFKKRLLWRGINVDVKECTCDNTQIDFDETDVFLLGGGTEREQKAVLEKLLEHKKEFCDFAENGGTILAVCGGFPLLGKELKDKDGVFEGLGVLDIFTDLTKSENRLIGNVILECEGLSDKVVGFENHGGRTDIKNHTPLGKVLKGLGNDGKSGFEGVVYKNVTATYLHGPLLPKNPELCDKILLKALQNKYSDFTELLPLNDELEKAANGYITEKYL